MEAKSLAILVFLLALFAVSGFLIWYFFFRNSDGAVVASPTSAPFWGCGLVGKDVDPTDGVWKRDIIDPLRASNRGNPIPVWNWAAYPQADDKYSEDFLFFPNMQCAGTNKIQSDSFFEPTTREGWQFAPLALGGNEPDQMGFCQQYKPDKPVHKITDCNSYNMRSGDGACSDCDCLSMGGGGCVYNVTGCGMWPQQGDSCATTSPFPFECFGAQKCLEDKACPVPPGVSPADARVCTSMCQDSMKDAFKDFYRQMAAKGYGYASTPIVASDLTFLQELLERAKCDAVDVKRLSGVEKLKQGCPTHSAFHFYSTGCPTDPDAAIEGFKEKVRAAKAINDQFGLEGTIVNELGSLKTKNDEACKLQTIATMMEHLFSFLETDEAKGVVKQMVWFNQDSVGGTFDLRLVSDGKITSLGTAYLNACKGWASSENQGVVAG